MSIERANVLGVGVSAINMKLALETLDRHADAERQRVRLDRRQQQCGLFNSNRNDQRAC